MAQRQQIERDWQTWLRACGPRTFTGSFAPFHADFWDWNWTLTQKLRNNEPITEDELVFLALWFRGAGKSSHVEWAAIAEGALVGSGYVLYVSGTQALAEGHVASIKERLESEEIARYYPSLGNPEIGKHGNQYGWRQNFLRTAGGWAIRPVGLDVGVRGGRVGDLRPTLIICHEKDTPMLHNGNWMPVQRHPTATLMQTNGFEIALHGLPFTEQVSADHRYWIREFLPGETKRAEWISTDGWKEAHALHGHCYIGMPIDRSVGEVQPIASYLGRSIAERDKKGRIANARVEQSEFIPDEFRDPEWWWLFGLWWGDGHTAGKVQVGLTVANTAPQTMDRIIALLDRYDRGRSIAEKAGCKQVIFTHSAIARWLKTWRIGNSRKQPPMWVERLPLEFQRELVRGYIEADGFVDHKGKAVRVTSIHLDGLLCLRRILGRLDIAATIRKGIGSYDYEINGHKGRTQPKYDLRFQNGAQSLGYDIPPTARYKRLRCFVDADYLWSKIRTIIPIEDITVAPIQTDGHSYQTHFGLSHNCDDIDDHNDSPLVVQGKLDTLSRSIIPAGTPRTRKFFAQNLIHRNSVANQIYTRKTDVLKRRICKPPIPAFAGLEVETRQTERGPLEVITAGSPTWSDIDLKACETFLNDSGRAAFLAEYQHDFSASEQGRVIPEYDEALHVITWSDFERVFGLRWIPEHWQREVGHDVGFTEAHQSAWTWIATSAMNSPLPGMRFRYRGLTFTGVGVDEQAEEVKRLMAPDFQLGRLFDEMPLIRSWRMSHEALSERMTYRSKHSLLFIACDSAKTAGIHQWRHYLRVDRTKAHPFKEDEHSTDGKYRLGCPAWFDIVDDDQLLTPRDDKGLATHRQETIEWRYRPDILGVAGLSKSEPMKKDENTADSCRMITATWGPEATGLTTFESEEAALSPERRIANVAKLPPEQIDFAMIRREYALAALRREREAARGNWSHSICDPGSDPWRQMQKAKKGPDWKSND